MSSIYKLQISRAESLKIGCVQLPRSYYGFVGRILQVGYQKPAYFRFLLGEFFFSIALSDLNTYDWLKCRKYEQ